MNKARSNAYFAEYRKNNPATIKIGQRRRNQRLKGRVLQLLGGKCGCGEERPPALTVDHVYNDGAGDRSGKTGYAVYREIAAGADLSRFQLLCWNCHIIKSNSALTVEKPSRAAMSLRRLRAEVIAGYGGVCGLCQCMDERVLTLDHVSGGGRLDRTTRRPAIWREARDGGFPSTFRVLCATCNALESFRRLENPVAVHVRDNRLSIPPRDWAYMKETIGWGLLRKYLLDATAGVAVLQDIPDGMASADFVRLAALTGDVLRHSRAGLLSSNRVHAVNRLNAMTPSGLTARQWWEDDLKRAELVDMLLAWGADEGVTATNFRRYLTLKARMPQQFRPAFAKWIYERFEAKRVLDCCAGWGDRLCGFCGSTSTSYTGIDPNSQLHRGYQSQATAHGGGKAIRLLCEPVEEVNASDLGRFDLSFTSPPYFNAERYSTEPTQSWVRYKTLDARVAGFLTPFFALQAAVVDGPVIVNIANHAKYDLERLTVGAAAASGLNLVETLEYPLSNRFGGLRYEPVFVFGR